MECKYCNQILKSASSLNQHQKTAKYCLSKQNKEPIKEHVCSFCGTGFSVKSTLNSHLRICKASNPVVQEQLQLLDETKNILELSLLREKENTLLLEKKIVTKDRVIKKIRIEYENKLTEKEIQFEKTISEKDMIIEEQKNIIKEFQEEYKNKLEKQNKDLTDRIHSMAEKAIAKPSTLNQNIINNMMPITDAHLQEHVQNLNPVHVQNGASGYAKYALEYPLKDMIVCTDFQRRNCKYKDENGNVVSDPEMTKITKRLFSAIKERNEELINEYSAELQAKWKSMNVSSNPDMDQEESEHFASKTNEALEIAMDILSQKRQTSEMANGMRPDLFYGFVRELAAGCYRSEKC
jgi:hypothetical protein